MKPSLLTLGLATSLLCGPALLTAQTKSPPPELLAAAPGWTADNPPWGTMPPPKPLPYGYVWNEYRGAEIEHPLYAPRHHGHVHRAPQAPCLVSHFCCWFDKLFARKCTGPEPGACGGHVSTELPPLPTLAPLPSAAAPQPENTPAELTPLPIPAPPQVALPTPFQGREPAPPVPPASSLDPTPVMPPVDLIPTRPLVTNDPPADLAPGQAPGEAPQDPVPALPVPAEPAPSPPAPAVVADPKPIASERTPVIELAPDFVVPGDLTPAAPQQVVPRDVLVPRNAIPQRAVPSNTIPGRRP